MVSWSPVERVPTQRLGQSASIPWLAEEISERSRLRPDGNCRGYGVVVPGIIDANADLVRLAPNSGGRTSPCGSASTRSTGLSGVVGHDVRVAGLAEWRRSRPTAQNLLFLALGTGVAGAIVVDGRMVEAAGYAGEIGHVRVAAAGSQRCACGQLGCLETVASAAGIARSYARLSSAEPSEIRDSRMLANLARTGDSAALQAFGMAVDALVEALVGYVTLLAPELIIIGGGLSGAADLFLPALTDGVRARLTFQTLPVIRTAALVQMPVSSAPG